MDVEDTLLFVLEKTFGVVVQKQKRDGSGHEFYVYIHWWMGEWWVDWGRTPFADRHWWARALKRLVDFGIIFSHEGIPHSRHGTAKQALDFALFVVKKYQARGNSHT